MRSAIFLSSDSPSNIAFSHLSSIFGFPLPHQPDLDIAEAGGGRPVAGVGHLLRLALAAVGRSPDDPVVAVAYGVAAGPELGRHARVGRVLDQVAQLALLDLAGE